MLGIQVKEIAPDPPAPKKIGPRGYVRASHVSYKDGYQSTPLSMKRWLYIVQQRLSITNTEASALLAVSFLLVVGLVAGEVRDLLPVRADDAYADSDRLFRQGAASATGRLMLAESDSAGTAATAEASVGDSSTVGDAGDAARVRTARERDRSGMNPMTIDLNTASADELQQLPRIGPALAARILAHRAEFGPFRRTSDIMQVRGIGEATYARMAPLLRIGGPGGVRADSTQQP